MAKPVLTETQWFLGITGKDGNVPDDRMLMRLLTGLGCQEIEPRGHGTAQARVPVEWAKAVEKNGFYTGSAPKKANKWIIDIDLP